MNHQLPDYQPRAINFIEIFSIDPSWKLKVYFINDEGELLKEKYEGIKSLIPEWLKMENSFDNKHDSIGFLIIHKAKEGFFYLINWWVGRNMLNGQIFFSPYEHPTTYHHISGDGLISCVWEMEVINHERFMDKKRTEGG
ncbi:MAG: hypothetical protein AAFO07_14535 [Bacteroidota bacterium]